MPSSEVQNRLSILQGIVAEELVQGFYVAARARFEPATLRTEGTEPTSDPPRPTWHFA